MPQRSTPERCSSRKAGLGMPSCSVAARPQLSSRLDTGANIVTTANSPLDQIRKRTMRQPLRIVAAFYYAPVGRSPCQFSIANYEEEFAVQPPSQKRARIGVGQVRGRGKITEGESDISGLPSPCPSSPQPLQIISALLTFRLIHIFRYETASTLRTFACIFKPPACTTTLGTLLFLATCVMPSFLRHT